MRPRFSTLVVAGVALTLAVLLVAAMLLGRSAESERQDGGHRAVVG